MTQADTGVGIAIPEDLREFYEAARAHKDIYWGYRMIVPICERIARLESELAQAQARLKRMGEPVTDEAELGSLVASRYGITLSSVNALLAARAASGEK